MYAVVTTGGKQYRVEAGSTLVVEKLAGEPGSSVTFDRVLLVGDGETVTVGTPTVDGASVQATVLGGTLGPKVVVFKFKQKVKYRRRTGHRQHFTRLFIDAISADGKTVTAEKPAAKAAPKKAAPRKAAPRKAAAKKTAAETEAPEASAEAPKTARRSRAAAATRSAAPAAAADASATTEKKPRSRGRTAPAATSSSAKGADEAKPRARRTAKPKAEPAKEE